MKARVARWGNSLAVRLPKLLAEKARLRVGEQVELEVAGPGWIEIRSRKSRPALEQLVAKITPENRHTETSWGDAVGKEIW
jgi:antitoxin MazE